MNSNKVLAKTTGQQLEENLPPGGDGPYDGDMEIRIKHLEKRMDRVETKLGFAWSGSGIVVNKGS